MKKNFLLFFLLFISQYLFSQNQYSISKNLDPIKIKFSEFNEILENLNHLIQKYDSLTRYANESYTIENEDTKQIFGESSASVKMIFNKAYSVSYQYSNTRGSIIGVNLELSDSYRKVTISGRNMLELETLTNYIVKETNKFKQPFGGSRFRVVLGLLLTLFYIILFLSSVLKMDFKGFTPRDKLISKRLFFAIGVYIFFLVGVAGIIEYQYIFPGFLMYADDTSFLSKNADLFTFLSFILSLLVILGFQANSKIKTE